MPTLEQKLRKCCGCCGLRRSFKAAHGLRGIFLTESPEGVQTGMHDKLELLKQLVASGFTIAELRDEFIAEMDRAGYGGDGYAWRKFHETCAKMLQMVLDPKLTGKQ